MASVQAKASQPGAQDVVYVTIPARDIYDYRFPDIRINEKHFPSGQTYALDPETAAVVQDRVNRRQEHDLRLMSNRAVRKVLHQLESGDTATKGANNGQTVPVFDAARLNAAGINIPGATV